jgi:hypothetical protein
MEMFDGTGIETLSLGVVEKDVHNGIRFVVPERPRADRVACVVDELVQAWWVATVLQEVVN